MKRKIDKRSVAKWHKLAYELEHDARRFAGVDRDLADALRSLASSLGNIARRQESIGE